MAALVPGIKLEHFTPNHFFQINQNNPVYHLGPVSPPGGDGSPLGVLKITAEADRLKGAVIRNAFCE